MYIPVEFRADWEVGVERREECGGEAWGYDGVDEVVETKGEEDLMDVEREDWEGEVVG